MTFTYDVATSLGRVRLEIGDTDSNAALFSDEEIEVYLTDNNDNVLATAADLCDALATRYALKADTTIGSLSFKWANVSKSFADRAQVLRRRGLVSAPFAGGISQSAKDNHANDSDRVQPRFTRDQFTNPATTVLPQLGDDAGTDN